MTMTHVITLYSEAAVRRTLRLKEDGSLDLSDPEVHNVVRNTSIVCSCGEKFGRLQLAKDHLQNPEGEEDNRPPRGRDD